MVKRLLEQIEKCESEINYEKHRDKYLETLVHSYPTLTVPEEKELFKLYKTTGDRTYKDIIFKCNLKVVHDTCTDTTGLREDLISEGIVLLCEFIDHYDYTMPYMTFTQALKTRLTVLYNSKRIENHKQLNTEMSTQDLEEREEKGECLTETEEIKPIRRKVYKETLVVLINEGINVVPRKVEALIIEPNPNYKNYILNREEGKKIFKDTFRDTPKKLINRPIRKFKPNDMEY